jgi:hypothetical protein
VTRHRLALLDLALVGALFLLWRTDAFVERARRERHDAESTFHGIATGAGAPAVAPAVTPPVTAPVTPPATAANVLRIDVTLPAGWAVRGHEDTRTWTYVRRADGWRLPQVHDAFALRPAIDGLLASLLESHGTQVGSLPRDAEHFGLGAGKTLDVDLFGSDGTEQRLLRASAGAVAPGQHANECFVSGAGDPRILHLAANPWSFVGASPAIDLPPALDRKLIPAALERRMPERIAFEGPWAPQIRELWRTAPSDADKAAGAARAREGRFQWFGRTIDGDTSLGAATAAIQYLSSLATLEWDELLPAESAPDPSAGDSVLTLTIRYEGGTTDTISLGPADPQGRHLLVHSATHLVASLSDEKAKQLVPGAYVFTPSAPPDGVAP